MSRAPPLQPQVANARHHCVNDFATLPLTLSAKIRLCNKFDIYIYEKERGMYRQLLLTDFYEPYTISVLDFNTLSDGYTLEMLVNKPVHYTFHIERYIQALPLPIIEIIIDTNAGEELHGNSRWEICLRHVLQSRLHFALKKYLELLLKIYNKYPGLVSDVKSLIKEIWPHRKDLIRQVESQN